MADSILNLEKPIICSQDLSECYNNEDLDIFFEPSLKDGEDILSEINFELNQEEISRIENVSEKTTEPSMSGFSDLRVESSSKREKSSNMSTEDSYLL